MRNASRLAHWRGRAVLVVAALLAPTALGAQAITDAVARPPASQGIDEAYSAEIRRFTTEPFFLTPLVDHVPASATVPSPLAHHGYIAGAADVLTYPDQVHAYMRAVAAASPRVRVETIGTSEEGREIVVVIISDEQTMQDLDAHKQMLRQLADPRRTNPAEAERIIARAKPVYYATGAMHSPETGSPEMLMELVYRLAVSEAPMIRQIRENAIVLLTPVVEVDGRAKQVDLHMAPRKDPNADVSGRLLYWGKYVAHDNNRDGMGLQLRLTQSILATFLDWNATVLHDLHESASYLYTSTGRGPYNAWVDPIVINEWSRLAYKEVNDLTALGVPGVYTYDFYDGWAPNYMFWIANMRNSIGRFYETQASRNASNYLLNTNVERQWHRPNTPLRQVVWSIRNNVNLQQSALLIALHEIGVNREEYLRNFYNKSARSIAKARAEGPAAYVFPGDDPRPGQQARLLSLLQRQGIEVHRAERAFRAGDHEFAAGSYVVRLDQPFSRTADMLLDRQYYNPDDPRPYDDVGWTHGPLFNVQTVRVEDTAVLDAPMQLVDGLVRPAGGVAGTGNARTFVVDYNADNNLTAFRFAHRDLRIRAAQREFQAAGRTFRPGSFIIEASENGGGDLRALLDAAGRAYGFTAYGVNAAPSVPAHSVASPRIAVMHTWLTTQTEGWLRLGLEEYGVPYDYISVHAVRDEPRLRDRYDVIIFGPSSPDALAIVRGIQGDRPIPWMKTDITPNLGSETSTPDMRGGLELQGVLNLSNFVQQGGTLVTLSNSASLPIHFGLAPGISIRNTSELWARGGVFRSVVADAQSPLAYGYGEDLGIYFNTAPVFQLGGTGFVGGFGGGGFGGGAGRAAPEPGATTARGTGRGAIDEQDIPQGRARDLGEEQAEQFRREQRGTGAGGAGGFGGFAAQQAAAGDVRVVLRYSPDVRNLLISGGLRGGEELSGAPALVSVRNGSGHVVMFSFNPFWRGGTLGSYALLFNALLHHGNLDAGRTAPAATAAANDGN
jgi:hypothetical protein